MDEHTINYATFMLQAPNKKRWAAFAGNCFLIGLSLRMEYEQIAEYIFESFHGLGITEIPKTPEDIKMDMQLYFGKEHYEK